MNNVMSPEKLFGYVGRSLLFSGNLIYYNRNGTVSGYIAGCSETIHCNNKAQSSTPVRFHPGDIDILLVTHAHIDHTGRIPLLVKRGFTGRILTTRVTADLMRIMLLDSAHIQESDAEYRNRKGQRAGARLC